MGIAGEENDLQKDQKSDDEPLLIVQVTDPHLCKEEDAELLGMNTRSSLDAVLQLIDQNHSDPDLVLATGDIAQDGSIEAYRCFMEKMGAFDSPVHWFSGNHDDRDAMRLVTVTGDKRALEKVVRVGSWQLIFLDSLLEGKVYGYLEESELAVLNEALSERPDLHSIICFHHHPVDIDSVWLDNIGLKNRDQLLEIVDRYENVRCLMWGHIHQEIDQYRNNVRLLATPSTCVQFLPKSKDFAVDSLAPGYRWLKLNNDGSINTGVERVEHIDFEVDYSSKGY